VSNSHEVMTALIVVLPLIVVVEISLHQASCGGWEGGCFSLQSA
jgi:ABC-type spermidine/putrescine transport system permease subunit II